MQTACTEKVRQMERQLHELREQIERRQILLRIDLMTREMEGRSHVV